MRMRIMLALALLPCIAQAQMYRWVDDQGKVHYSDQAPDTRAKNVQKQSLSAGSGSTAALPYALQQSVRNFPVTLYTADTCKDACTQAREYLAKRGVPYTEVDVRDEADLAKLKSLSGGLSVPVLTVGREITTGFESGVYKTALDAAGYPAASMLPPGVQARQAAPKPAAKPAPAAAEAKPAEAEAKPDAAPDAGNTNPPK